MSNDANTGAYMSPTMRCSNCLQPVIEGPEGGYVCGLCYHLVEPDGYEVRRKEGVKRAAEARQERAEVRRLSKERKQSA
ncbi:MULTISPECIES: hypothetical protein [unclassified Streptomyces]|uniref:hypothetical protein n=1 Tax=unclassified Streptomyces TaxID=2593676 RepID=UPI0013C6F858|nr:MULTISPECIES: hypothetical protein [unclassified Streptomyces]MCZ4095682.1 hypothetical protein [Streptomyces sp. H39-C1]NEA72175.1 hypothetical protein [Streptomyces sp. SID13588]